MNLQDKINNNFNGVYFIPPIIVTILICIFQDAWYLLILVLPLFIVWSLILIAITFLFHSEELKIDNNLATEITKGLNIDKNKWKKYSKNEKKILYDYYQRQVYLKNITVKNIIWNKKRKINDYKKLLKFNEDESNLIKIISNDIEKQWENYTLEERILKINENEIKKKEEYKKNQDQREKELIIEQQLAVKREKERLFTEEQEKLVKQIEEKKKQEENAIKQQTEQEERKKLEQIQRQELLIEKKKQKDIEYKERMKRQLLEKERLRHLESEAIQELIENGQLSENYSLQHIRVPIPGFIKEAVWKRDKQSCVTCGSQENLEFDHNIPVSKGGSNSINNIQLLCQKCNRTKNNKIM